MVRKRKQSSLFEARNRTVKTVNQRRRGISGFAEQAKRAAGMLPAIIRTTNQGTLFTEHCQVISCPSDKRIFYCDERFFCHFDERSEQKSLIVPTLESGNDQNRRH